MLSDIIKNRFIKPTKNKKTGIIGVELEFPLLNLAKTDVDKRVALMLLEMLINDGFEVLEYDTEKQPAFVANNDGDCISYDNSYNNIEFSMNYGNDLNAIRSRFYALFNRVQRYFEANNHMMTGMGTNPYKKYVSQNHVSYPVYNMVDEYLHRYDCDKTHSFPDFPAYLSSVQTHLDISPEDLPKTATLFAKIDFLRGLLFSNSPDFEISGIICYRDYLWHKSAFGICNKNTGAVDEEYITTEDIEKSFYDRSMFNCIRNGKYHTFKPVLLGDYFANNPQSDIDCFLSFRHIEFTCRGTLEIRSDCTQPVSEAFLPPAFNLGITHNIDKAICCTTDYFKDINYTNSELRRYASNNEILKILDKDVLVDYAVCMSRIARDGLLSRGLGEEVILEPVFKRANELRCPAHSITEHKGDIDNIIIEYAKEK